MGNTATPNFDHERPTEMDDFEFELPFANTPTGRTLYVFISKVGGGTPGKSYTDEYWHYMATTEGQGVVMEGSDMRIAGAATHADAAEMIFDRYCAE